MGQQIRGVLRQFIPSISCLTSYMWLGDTAESFLLSTIFLSHTCCGYWPAFVAQQIAVEMRVFETSLPKRIARCSVVRSQPVRARTAQVRNLTQGAPRAPPPFSRRHVVAHSGHVEDFVLSTLNTDEELEREKTCKQVGIHQPARRVPALADPPGPELAS